MTRMMPPEFAKQDLLWIGFPYAEKEWPGFLAEAQVQLANFANAVAETGQEVRLVVRDDAVEARARALVSSKVTLIQHAYGDVWLRDTGPLVTLDADGNRFGQLFGFNGWGGKFIMPGDQTVGADMADSVSLPHAKADWVLEGGSIDCDGTGLVAATMQCLLNPNRNPNLTQADIEMRLQRDLGFDRVLWLGDGLIGDHTDGHIDNLARFVGEGRIAIPAASGTNDPNAEIYADARQRARDFGLTVCEIPSPGRVGDDDDAEPASYMNFAICNDVVVVPTYGTAYDDEAVAAIDALFDDRTAVGVRANAVLAGGGSFHCSSQQLPSVPQL